MNEHSSDKIEPPEREAEDVPIAEKSPLSRWKPQLQKLAWPLHARFPNFVPNPFGDERDYFRKRDAEDNEETQIDEGVKLNLACISVSEIFGPNEVDSLYTGLEKLGWDKDRWLMGESNVSWLKEQRLYGSEGTLPLGWVHRAEDMKKYVNVRYTADFPQEFSSLLVNISQVTPSVTCMTIGFILTDESSMEYSNAIAEPRKTTRFPKRGSRSYQIKSVEHMKEDAVGELRQKYRELGISWITKFFAGFFAQQCERSHFPSTELLILEGFMPFDKEPNQGKSWKHWARFVNIDSAHGSWVSTTTPSLRFSFETNRRNRLPNHITAALRWDGLSEEDTKFNDGKTLGSRAYFVNERLAGIATKHALGSYLREILRGIKEVRQSLASDIDANGSNAGAKQINAYFLRNIGVPAIAREALELSKNDSSFRWNVSGFTEQSLSTQKEPYDITKGLKYMLGQLATRLLDEDRDTRELLNQLSSAMGTKESIFSQRRMEFVTVIALAVSLVSLLVSFASK